MSDLYQEVILEELKNPQHQGELHGDEILTKQGVNASCGDEVTIFIRQAKGDVPLTIKWQGVGCAISMATMSLLADKINTEQLAIEQIMKLTESDLLELLGLDQISIGRTKCMMLGLRTIKSLLV